MLEITKFYITNFPLKSWHVNQPKSKIACIKSLNILGPVL